MNRTRFGLFSILFVASQITAASAQSPRATSRITVLGLRPVVGADLELKESTSGLRLLNTRFPDGRANADGGILFNRSPARSTPACQGTCRSSPNANDYCEYGQHNPYSCLFVLDGNTCRSADSTANPCLDVSYTGGESRVSVTPRGTAVSINGDLPAASWIAASAPRIDGTTLQLHVYRLPTVRTRLVLYLVSTGGPADGCFTISLSGHTARQYVSVGGTAQGEGGGELVELQLAGSHRAVITESTGACGHPGISSSSGTVALSGIFLLPQPGR